ncbi:MAG TPA: peptide-methionine (S)-S-oxide reductase MsrA [Bacteroidia bacterium]|nr:peptide-methionine (S)-S-oxide reductase MsrA [Bacteroidia bacterium]
MKNKISLFVLVCGILSLTQCTGQNVKPNLPDKNRDSASLRKQQNTTMENKQTDTATFAAGCFWCVEAVFQDLNGVISVTSGYSGGQVKNPSYREVCNGTTGHAEACNIVYDPTKITYDELLEVFWKTHDPTTLNRQGNDEGTQYRSAIFYHNETQKQLAEKYKKELDASGAFNAPIVTEISAYTNFYKADDYHQNYFNENGDLPYCRFVIQPKVEKFKKVFKDKLKK